MNFLLPRFLLPKALREAHYAAICEEPPVAQQYTARMASPVSILLAEDSELDREVIGTRLREWNTIVTEATSRTEAIGLVNAGAFDVAMVDMRLPWEGNGIAVMRAIRSRIPDIPICAYSAGAFTPGDVSRICEDVGPVTFASKLTNISDRYLRDLFIQFRLARRAGMTTT